ncbi:hypothetical protein N9954_04865 [Maribacter sp.]|nr:hypothetical protein [Maribacter sp.]
MRNYLLKTRIPILVMALFVTSCTNESEEEEIVYENVIRLTNMETSGFIYSEIVFNHKGYFGNCGNVTVLLSNGSASKELEIKPCEPRTITAWIPEDMAAGNYNVSVTIDGTLLTSIADETLQVEVLKRPVILGVDKTEVERGGTLELSGLNLQNTTGNPRYNTRFWIFQLEYLNTASPVEVSTDGTTATIILDAEIPSGNHEYFIWGEAISNQLVLTIL